MLDLTRFGQRSSPSMLVSMMVYLLVFVLHGILLFIGLNHESPDKGDAQDNGKLGVTVGLGQIGHYADVKARLQSAAPEQASDTVEPPVEAVPETPREALPQPVLETVNTVADIQMNMDQTELENLPEPQPDKPVQQQTVSEPEQAPVDVTEPIPVEDVEDPNDAQQTQAASMAAKKDVGDQQQQAGGVQGHQQAYLSEIIRRVSKFKRYPKAARKSARNGIVTLAFTINRDGRVLDASIHQSSGSKLFDRAAIKMIYAAQPLPKPPDDVMPEQQRLSLMIPVNYTYQ